tara:strand:+ start:148 stop:333 length:186 start_codon:yes stop_codon:yes gene_type:complete
MQRRISLSLNECRKVYEAHFERDLPGDLPFQVAAQQVFDALGRKRFLALLDSVKTNGGYTQ